MRYWINTISREHVRRGVAGGFTQADHGKATRLRHLTRGDIIVFYSPRTDFKAGEPLKAFTAIGRIADDEPYQVEMSPDFHPWRRSVHFFDAAETPIQPLIPALDFIKKKDAWGLYFRRGLFEVAKSDLQRLAEAMHAVLEDGVA